MPLVASCSGQRQFPWPGDSDDSDLEEDRMMTSSDIREDNGLVLWWAGPLGSTNEQGQGEEKAAWELVIGNCYTFCEPDQDLQTAWLQKRLRKDFRCYVVHNVLQRQPYRQWAKDFIDYKRACNVFWVVFHRFWWQRKEIWKLNSLKKINKMKA